MSCVWTSPSGSLLYTSHLNCLSVGQNLWPEKFALFSCNEVGTENALCSNSKVEVKPYRPVLFYIYQKLQQNEFEV